MSDPMRKPVAISADDVRPGGDGAGTVLIADNDTAVNSLLTAILTDKGLHCVSVFDGEEALARLHEGGIDVLVTDLDMPKLDGRQLLGRLAEIDPQPATLVISGYLDTVAEDQLRQYAAVRQVLRKPFDVMQFAVLVEQEAKACRSSGSGS
jgi:DNA-binding NtrC family response regulator